MTTQEMIFDYLKVQGLVPEYDEDKDIRFKYQMRNFVVSNYPDDRQFLQIMMPFIILSYTGNSLDGTMFHVAEGGWEVHKYIVLKSFIVLSSWIFVFLSS